MGVSREVPAADPPPWTAVAARLAAGGFPASVRMIDGLPAFPDEVPAADWRELRLTVPGGMVTVHRTPGGVRLVTWGTDDPALLAALEACVRAWADPDLHPGGG